MVVAVDEVAFDQSYETLGERTGRAGGGGVEIRGGGTPIATKIAAWKGRGNNDDGSEALLIPLPQEGAAGSTAARVVTECSVRTPVGSSRPHWSSWSKRLSLI